MLEPPIIQNIQYVITLKLESVHFNTGGIEIPVRSQLQGRKTSSWSYCETNLNNCSMVSK